jgi:hypothetical protein
MTREFKTPIVLPDGTVIASEADIGTAIEVFDGATPVVDALAAITFGTGLLVTDDGGGAVTVDSTGGGGGGGSIAVKDDGTTISAAVDVINFGTDLSVTDDGGGEVTITASAGIDGDGINKITVGSTEPTSPDDGDIWIRRDP